MTDPTYRFRGNQPPIAGSRASVLSPTPTGDNGEAAELMIYDPIDSWGGDWGVSAKEFSQALNAIPDTVKTINLRLNSPGGEVWDALAIVNLLQRHPATVVAHVDGIAASAASFIAAACDEVVMGAGAQLMLHDAWSVAIGDAVSLRSSADRLDTESNGVAAIYAKKAGGTTKEWRAVMQAGGNRETWYNAEEAVAVGLADRLGNETNDPTAPEPTTVAASAKAMLKDMPGIVYLGGRAEAPAPMMIAKPHPVPPTATEPSGSTTNGRVTMTKLADGLRSRLGIKPDAELDEDGLLAALDEALEEQVAPEDEETEPATTALPEGVVAVEASALDALRQDAAAGRAARNQQLAAERVAIVDKAIAEGRVLPARRQHWIDSLAADPGQASLVATLPQVLSLEEIGHQPVVDVDADDAFYLSIFPDEKKEH